MPKKKDPSLDDQLIIHLEYHPDDIPRKEVREICKKHCGELFENILGVKKPLWHNQGQKTYETCCKVQNYVKKKERRLPHFSGASDIMHWPLFFTSVSALVENPLGCKDFGNRVCTVVR